MFCTPNHKFKIKYDTLLAYNTYNSYVPLILKYMQTTEEWLKEKVLEYKQYPKQTLEDMLATTNDVMLQYKNNPTSEATKGLFDTCIEHNKLFLVKIGVIDGD